MSDNIKHSCTTTLIQTTNFINAKLLAISNIIDAVSFDENIQNILNNEESFAREMKGNWFVQNTDSENIIYNPYTTKDIKQIKLFSNQEHPNFFDSKEFETFFHSDTEYWKMYEKILKEEKVIILPSTINDTILIVKMVPDRDRLFHYIGMIGGILERGSFDEIIVNAPSLIGMNLLVLANQHVVAASDKTIPPALVHAFNQIDSNGILEPVQFQDKEFLAGSTQVEIGQWKVIAYYDMSFLKTMLVPFARKTLLIYLLVIAAAIPLIIWASKLFTKRISNLQDHINNSFQNDFEIIPLDNGNDEIGDLTKTYDLMALKIKELMETQFLQGYKINDLKFQLLQEMINPHFLYNSLNMIYLTALQNKDLEVAQISQKLSNFYKLSFGHGETIVTLQNEIEMIQNYIAIQNIRFDMAIQLVLEIDTNLYPRMINKMLLQPLVENCIIHGIMEKTNKSGTIVISIKESEQFLLISIIDDGIGIAPTTLAKMNSSHLEDTGDGIKNITNRLRLRFENRYSLTFFSILGKGTEAKLKIPLE
jgi:two-component system sensor histidine kinase YesM